MLKIPVVDHDTLLGAVTVIDAIALVRAAFLAGHSGRWAMPPKVYLQSPPYGDFRAMPALGDGVALVKWITSFPGNREHGLPVVTGVICLSDATTGLPLMLLDARAVTALRTGAAAAVSAQALARSDARTVGLIGCGWHGLWAARSLRAVGFTAGVCVDSDQRAAKSLSEELGWETGSLAQALACDVVCCVTPGVSPVVNRAGLQPGQHFVMLGADGPGKAEETLDAVTECRLFCDDWVQASHGGELAGVVEAGLINQDQVTEIGAVLAGSAPGRTSPEEITLFDSTGLAIQDLAVASAALRLYRDGALSAQTVQL